MKFGKEYDRRIELLGIGLKRLKKMLKIEMPRLRPDHHLPRCHRRCRRTVPRPLLRSVFDPVSLSCGHIFCYLCSCSAASVTIVDGLKSADHKSKCPLCRQAGVFPNAVHLEEMNMLIKYSCPEYWEKRMQMERVQRARVAKEHWESQCRAFLGI